jgi:hypothetical protein
MRFRRWTILALFACLTISGGLLAQTSGTNAKKAAKSPGSTSAGLQPTLEKLERSGWEAYKNKDKKAYEALLADDFTAGFEDGHGQHDKQSAVNSVEQETLHSYTLSNFRLTSISPNAALLTFDAQVNITIGSGKPQDVKLYVSDVWVNRGGQWKSLHYQETERK